MTIPIVKCLEFEPRVKCESDMLDPITRRHDLHCKVFARYSIDGKPMCKRHAGSYLVDLLVCVHEEDRLPDPDEAYERERDDLADEFNRRYGAGVDID